MTKGDKDQDEVDTSTVTSGVSIPVSDPEKAHEALAGPDPEPMNEDQTGSDSGKLHVSLAGPNPEHMDDEFLATAYPKVHENLKLITDERVIDDKPESHSGSMSSMKNLDDTFNFGDQFLHDKPTEDDQEKSKVREESDSTIPDSSHQTVTSTPPVIVPFTEVSSSKPSLLVTPPPINTEATTITTSLPEITPFIALQLRVARLEQEMSEVKKTDHSADVLAGCQLYPKILRYLIEKYSVLPGPESTDEVDLEEFDLKSALFSHMNKKKSANRNTTNYRLYHALMEALIADEDAMDKEVADKVKDHKRKHDTKPPPKADEPNLKENQGSPEHLLQTTSNTLHKQDAITDTREAGVDSSMHRSDPESEHSEQSSDDISKQDEGNDSDMEDTDNAHIPNEREYDISADLWHTHLRFRRERNSQTTNSSESFDRETVKSQMRILSVISVKVFENYGYNYLRETILHRADYQEYKISEKDFKKLHQNDFEDLSSHYTRKAQPISRKTDKNQSTHSSQHVD
ncbi:hypothetical protein Tco_1406271 [Tanacetum coccineum]